MITRLAVRFVKYSMALAFSFIITSSISSPQPKIEDSVKFKHYFNVAESLKKEVKFKKAITSYKSALVYSNKLKNLLIVMKHIRAVLWVKPIGFFKILD